jgi:hypothetical protein
MELQSGLERAWTNTATFVPNLVAFLLVLALGYFIAKAIGKVVDKVLERVGFDHAVERGGIKQAMARSKYDASDIVSKLVFYTLFLLVLQLAFGVFGLHPVLRDRRSAEPDRGGAVHHAGAHDRAAHRSSGPRPGVSRRPAVPFPLLALGALGVTRRTGGRVGA